VVGRLKIFTSNIDYYCSDPPSASIFPYRLIFPHLRDLISQSCTLLQLCSSGFLGYAVRARLPLYQKPSDVMRAFRLVLRRRTPLVLH